MRPLIIDVETTIFQKGNPHADRNKLCYLGCYDGVSYRGWRLDGFGEPYGEKIREICAVLRDYDLVVGFNIKFDLHWMKRYGIPNKFGSLWDLQLCHFICSGQATPLPSLDSACNMVSLSGKCGDIAAKYWDKNIDTPDIPIPEMEAYLENDCRIEWDLFQFQIKHLSDKPKLKRLIWNACQDLQLTGEMEDNGILYDIRQSRELGDKKLLRIQEIDRELDTLAGVEAGTINWNSGEQLSTVLYGGTLYTDGTEDYEFHYKDGRTANKRRKVRRATNFARIVEPLRGTAAAKDGNWLTNEGILHKLHHKALAKPKQIIQLQLERSALDTQVNRYLHGIPDLYDEMDWTDSIIHGQLQHSTARTGRLASSKPNIQNLTPEALSCIKTRFPKKLPFVF